MSLRWEEEEVFRKRHFLKKFLRESVMKHKRGKFVIGFVLTFLLHPSLVVHAQVFSLDDSTADPLTITPLPAPLPGSPGGAGYGVGAEDPFGFLLGPPGFAPSPSLFAAGVIDGDILMSSGGGFGPVLNTFAPFDAFGYGTGIALTTNDAMSNNSLPSAPFGASYNLLFSVDRFSAGIAASASAVEAGFGQQPGDIYVSTASFPDPAVFAGGLPFGAGYIGPIGPLAGGSNALLFDESFFELEVGLGPGALVPAGVPVPFPAPQPGLGVPASHDNIDAFELRLIDSTGDGVEDIDYFSSISADLALSAQFATGGFPFDSADIWYTPAGSGGFASLFAPAVALGVTPYPAFPPPLPLTVGNDVDALVVWDVGSDGVTLPGRDYALFSLAPGSIDLAIFGLSPDDIFFTDFSGSYGLYAAGSDIGLTGFDNVDALEVVLTGDANLDGMVDFLDFSALSACFLLPGCGWAGGDFNGDGTTDFLDFSAFSGNFMAFTSAIQTVPEPSSVVVLSMGILGFCATGRRR